MVDTIAPSLASAQESVTKSQSAQASASANFDTFLQLLAAQLQNQDPLDPLDGTQFTEQIASFSAVEQQIATNSNLEKLLQNESYAQQSMAIGFVGKEVLSAGDVAPLKGGQMELTYVLPEDAVSNVIEIYDGDGVKIKTIEGEVNQGQYAYLWDGTNDAGEAMPEGNYFIDISAFDAEGVSVNPRTFVYQKVTGVRSDGEGGIFLGLANGQEVSLSEAFTLREAYEDAVASGDSAEDDSNDDV